MEWKCSGCGFLWSLYLVVGIWVLLIYLMSVLIGLWWLFDWYCSVVSMLLGVLLVVKY